MRHVFNPSDFTMPYKRKTFFLDQGEFLGGAERFLIDFLKSLTAAERRKIGPVLVGGENAEYQKLLGNALVRESVDSGSDIELCPFKFPQVRGNIFVKLFRVFELLLSARKLVKLSQKKGANQFFTNTPRTHFVLFFAKKVFRLKGRWICIFHDFSTRPNFLLRAICNQADILIANSLPTRNFLRQKIAEKNFGKIRLVENGINFDRLPEFLPAQKIEKILLLGRIDPQKGQLFAIKAANLLLKQEKPFRVSIVGSPVEKDKRTMDYDEELKKIVRDQSLSHVHFYSEVPDPFVEIAKHDLVLVLPTEPETFGRVVIEALALGKLVLSFDETGPREILQNFYQFLGRKNVYLEKNPFLVKPQDEVDLAEKIYFFMENSAEVEKFCALAPEFVRSNYALSETKKRFFEILVES